jgi:hypothetical protein
MRELTFKDTDTMGLGASSPLAGTRTCWYTGMASVTDVYNKPDRGYSKVNKNIDPKTN